MKDRGWAEKLKNYYQRDLRQLYKFLTSGSQSVLVLGKEQVSSGRISLPTTKKREYIIISDALGVIYDIQATFHGVRKICNSETRLVFNFQSFLWQPFLDLAELAGLKSKQPRVNWLTETDIKNLLELEGFEIVKTGRRFLLPFPIGAISDFVNKYFAQLPWVNRICLTSYVVAKPSGSSFKHQPTVSIVIPARNEEGNIESVVSAFKNCNPGTELIFVEGQSKDNTWEEIRRVQKKYRGVKIIAARQPGVGKADAVRKGFSLAKNAILFVWDADLTVPPKDFNKFYEPLVSGKSEFIFGSRLVYPLEKDSMRLLNIFGNKFFSWAFSWLLGQPIKDTLCGTKAISKKNYLRLAKNRNYFGDFDPFGDFDLIFGAAKLNLKFTEIPIRYQSRKYGDTNISRFKHGWLLIKMAVTALNKLKFV